MEKINTKIPIEIIEIPDEKAPERMHLAEEEMVKEKEGIGILKQIGSKAYVITLEIQGARMSTEQFQKKMYQFIEEGKEEICFVIGGSLGLSETVRKRSNFALSFSEMTFPHQLMRVILMEQLNHIFFRD